MSNCSASVFCESLCPYLGCVWVCLFTTLPLGRNHEGSLKIERLIHQDLRNIPTSHLSVLSFFITLSFHRSHLMGEWSSFNATTTMSFCFCFVVNACVYMVVHGHSHFSHVNCMFGHQIQPTFTFPLTLHRYHTSFIFLLPTPLVPFLSPHLPPTTLPYVMHHLCRAGRPIITTACKYWSTAPVCMCYFKIFRPVISVLMIVIAKATRSVWFFQACTYQWRSWQPEHKHANKQKEGITSRDGGMLVF